MTQLPMYQVISNELASRITSGELAPNDRLPSESELAEQFGVSRMTVRQALDRLSEQHLLLRKRGAGTFVAAGGRPRRQLNRLASFRDELGLGSRRVDTLVKSREVLRPPEDVRQALRLKPRAAAVRLVRVRLVEDAPASIQDSWIPYAVAPALASDDLLDGSLYRTLRDRYGVELRFAEQEISAAEVDDAQAEWLQVRPRSPVMLISRTTYTYAAEPVEFARSWTLPQFALHVRLEA